MWTKFEQYLVETRYSIRDENGNPLEKTYDEVLDRICGYIEEQEKKIRLGIEVQAIIKALKDKKIITATPFLMNAGNNKTRHKGFFSCYPLGPVPDSTKGIMETVLRMVNIYQSAGGVGVDVSQLRPKGALVDNGQGKSSGPVTFLQMFDAVAGTISQGGKRRGALMVQMDWNHPDIKEFVKCKTNKVALTNMNISVNVFGDFWKNEEIIDLIAQSIWECGDPGLLYIENMMKNSPLTSKDARYVNPCVTGDTLVTTDKGLVPIKELAERFKKGEEFKVLNGNGNYTKPTRVWKTRENTKTVTIEFTDGHKLKTTPDHNLPVATLDEMKEIRRKWSRKEKVDFSQLKKKKAIELTENDYVITENFLQKGILCRVKQVVENKELEDVYNITEPETHLVFYNGILSKNCGEYISEPNTACNLLTVNVSEFDTELWYEEARHYGNLACQLGNLILELDGYPDKQIEYKTRKLRPVGVGITGYHKLLRRCGVKYKDSVEFDKKLQAHLTIGTMEASAKFLKKKPVVKWDPEYTETLVEKAKEYLTFSWLEEQLRTNGGLSNCLTTVQAPTGSISQLLHVMCTGIEPYFAKQVKRKVKDEQQEWVEFILEDEFAEVEEVTPKQQIDVLCAFQEFVHASISKTINLPAETTKEEIKEFIKYTYNKNLKGLTAFRDSSKEGILTAVETKEQEGKRYGVTYKFEGPASLYVTANKINGKLHELFVICSKPGRELKSLTDGLGRAISVGLQSGTPPSKFARTLEHLEGEAVFTNPVLERPSKSICDAISNVIKAEMGEAEHKAKEKEKNRKGLCPYCGEWSVVRDGGCKKCLTCGYTSC